jgi:hypothetical protein
VTAGAAVLEAVGGCPCVAILENIRTAKIKENKCNNKVTVRTEILN